MFFSSYLVKFYVSQSLALWQYPGGFFKGSPVSWTMWNVGGCAVQKRWVNGEITDKQMGKRKEWGEKGLLGHSRSHDAEDSQPDITAWESVLLSEKASFLKCHMRKTDWQIELIPIHVNSPLAYICGYYRFCICTATLLLPVKTTEWSSLLKFENIQLFLVD